MRESGNGRHRSLARATKLLLLVTLILTASLPGLGQRPPTNLRGKVVGVMSNGRQVAMPYQRVALYRPIAGGKLQLVKATYTDRSGMFYLYSIAPGVYTVDVKNGAFKHTLTVKPPVPNKRFQDLPIVKLKI